MKWQCNNCTNKDGLSSCTLDVAEDLTEYPSWCPWALNPLSEDSYPAWEPIVKVEEGGDLTFHATHDPVTNPSHYTEGRKYEPIDVIEDWGLDFCLANALKYISRAGRKGDAVEDLKKAVFYLNREITKLEGE